MVQAERRSKRLGMVAVLVVSTLALVACGSSDESDATTASTSGTTSMKAAFFPGFGTLPIQVADTQGFFARQGLDVETLPSTSMESMVAGLGRQHDVMMSTPVDLIVPAARGIDIKAFSGLQDSARENPNTPIMTRDPSIRTVRDLAGKNVGVPALVGASYVSLQALLEEAGVDPSSVRFVPTPFPNLVDQLNAGRVDAGVSATPFTTILEQQGYRKVFDPVVEASGEDQTLNAFFSTTSRYAERDPEALAAFRAALEESIAWIEANEPEARRELAAWLRLPPEIAERAPLPIYDAAMSADRLAPWIRVAERGAGIENAPDPSELVIETR